MSLSKLYFNRLKYQFLLKCKSLRLFPPSSHVYIILMYFEYSKYVKLLWFWLTKYFLTTDFLPPESVYFKKALASSLSCLHPDFQVTFPLEGISASQKFMKNFTGALLCVKEKTALSSDDEKLKKQTTKQKNSNPERTLNLWHSFNLQNLSQRCLRKLFYTSCRKVIFAVFFFFSPLSPCVNENKCWFCAFDVGHFIDQSSNYPWQ